LACLGLTRAMKTSHRLHFSSSHGESTLLSLIDYNDENVCKVLNQRFTSHSLADYSRSGYSSYKAIKEPGWPKPLMCTVVVFSIADYVFVWPMKTKSEHEN